ncbi:M67 family metallopeptidase [Geobacter sp. SVR]|uniref:M67 family metallopeptidase n=1 Tax=Geobacter sp. SVR TaxID=2495594 RepID=UPI00143EF9C9|nr:M67 family metallopeptidase [Geobacter sp. SVR]BCS53393.1 Mov34/MPN/PAD-1 family protein [Geobacter sp. SVR]GCF85481.1 Mov34/MPN/PAD-1 family protein [Geobacter sp. SVR]
MLKIPVSIYNDLVAHAREGFPLEVCGILGGTADTVSAIYRMTNTDASNEHFMMEPREQFAVVKDLRAKGLSMLAIYHSHPETPARPSEEDIRLALTPGVSYVIASLAEAEAVVKSYRIEEGRVEHEGIEITAA